MVFPPFSPPILGGNGGVLSMHLQVILDSLFARPGSANIEGGKKGEFRDWTRVWAVISEIVSVCFGCVLPSCLELVLLFIENCLFPLKSGNLNREALLKCVPRWNPFLVGRDHVLEKNTNISRARGGGVLPIMAYTGRLRPKGVPFSGFRYKKG